MISAERIDDREQHRRRADLPVSRESLVTREERRESERKRRNHEKSGQKSEQVIIQKSAGYQLIYPEEERREAPDGAPQHHALGKHCLPAPG